MTDHHDDEHDNDLDLVPWDQLSTDAVLAIRTDAFYYEDLARTLRADNELDTRLELADFSQGRRRTCRACGGWADHIHDPLTDEPMMVPWWYPTFTRADVEAITQLAWQVFALASFAPRWAWDALADGSHRVTVPLKASNYRVIVPADDADGRPGTAYIDNDYTGAPDLRPPVIYANPRTAAAIADARRYLTPPA
ncbi:hypothetical protein [Nocardia jiangxiensis]|uniref:hypothetical protein n=1 Tax=Nocardia jiangxiensis TaxID=282685 RepID=UPI0003067D22|nr:hypothetical protein [Nocardia jiangxiensis]